MARGVDGVDFGEGAGGVVGGWGSWMEDGGTDLLILGSCVVMTCNTFSILWEIPSCIYFNCTIYIDCHLFCHFVF